jgi:nucleotide-binding universal stress UspA family protein
MMSTIQGTPIGGGPTLDTSAPGLRDARRVPDDKPGDRPPESCARSRGVLVVLHGLRAHLGAIEMARHIARALHAPLHGLFLGPEPIEASEIPARVGVPLEALEGVVLDIAVGEDPGEALVAAADSRSTAFVVIASAPGELPDERLGVGELAARALLGAICGVVILGEAMPVSPLRRILLPLDGTPSTAAAITPAGELARRLGAELDIVMVGGATPGEPPAPGEAPPVSTPAPREPGAMGFPLYVDQPHHEWPAFTEEFRDRFLNAIGHCPADVSTRFFVGAGEPAAEILRLAGELRSDLLVLVWHGELGGAHGRVFCHVLANARCPVLVLRR